MESFEKKTNASRSQYILPKTWRISRCHFPVVKDRLRERSYRLERLVRYTLSPVARPGQSVSAETRVVLCDMGDPGSPGWVYRSALGILPPSSDRVPSKQHSSGQSKEKYYL